MERGGGARSRGRTGKPDGGEGGDGGGGGGTPQADGGLEPHAAPCADEDPDEGEVCHGAHEEGGVMVGPAADGQARQKHDTCKERAALASHDLGGIIRVAPLLQHSGIIAACSLVGRDVARACRDASCVEQWHACCGNQPGAVVPQCRTLCPQPLSLKSYPLRPWAGLGRLGRRWRSSVRKWLLWLLQRNIHEVSLSALSHTATCRASQDYQCPFGLNPG